MAGDYILAIASTLIAGLKHDEVTLVLSQVSNFTTNIFFDSPFPLLLDRKLCYVIGHTQWNNFQF